VGEDGGGGLKAVQMAVARLRKCLEPLQPGDTPLRTVSSGYLLTVAPGGARRRRLRGLPRTRPRAARRRRPVGASEAFEAALALWRGPALAEVAFESFAQPEIKRLEELRLGAL